MADRKHHPPDGPEAMLARLAHAEAEEVEEEIHIDERWLISYADKMTILCGFFIMLFAISTLDPVKLKQVQKSAEKSFGKPQSKEEKIQAIDPQEVTRLQEQQKRQQQQIQALEQRRLDLEKTLATIKQTDNKKELQDQLKKALESRQLEENRAKAYETQTKTLTERVAELEKELTKLRLKQPIPNTDLQPVVENLRKELEIAKSNSAGTGFIAFVMSWGTRDQDMDLSVEDPKRKVFDFKHREFGKDHPGLLVLDTRQGPGVEVWQSDRIIPGTYTFTYAFYNPYGNPAPCPITGTLFTSKGRVDLPKVTLDPENKKVAKFRINIDDNGKATLLK